MPKSQIEIQGEIVCIKPPDNKKKVKCSESSKENFLDVLASGLAELVGVDPDGDESPEEHKKG